MDAGSIVYCNTAFYCLCKPDLEPSFTDLAFYLVPTMLFNVPFINLFYFSGM